MDPGRTCARFGWKDGGVLAAHGFDAFLGNNVGRFPLKPDFVILIAKWPVSKIGRAAGDRLLLRGSCRPNGLILWRRFWDVIPESSGNPALPALEIGTGRHFPSGARRSAVLQPLEGGRGLAN